jgi:methylisocitrate lyase
MAEMMKSMPHPGRTLRDAIALHTVVCPGAFNALVARSVRRAGFEACYISGGATANCAGYPDIGLITLTEMCRTIREVATAARIPVVVDADTGYGEIECVVRTVREYDAAGAAALHLEDQVFPKRCGHLGGKTLVPMSDMVEKIGAACAHRPHADLVIIARTDARGVNGMAEAIERSNAYRAAGADMVFPEGLESEDEFRTFAEGSPGPLLANMTEFGRTPDLPAARFGELGYRLVIYPLSMMRLAMGHVERGLAELKTRGTMHGLLGEMQPRNDLYDLLDYDPDEQWNVGAK